MTRRERLNVRLAVLLQNLLKNKGSWSGGATSGTSLDGRPVNWLLTAQRAGERISLIETVTATDQSFRVIRYWLLKPVQGDKWLLETADKNHEPLDDEWIDDELEDTIGRLEDPQTARFVLEVPKARVLTPIVPFPSSGLWPRRFRSVAGLAFFICVLFILASSGLLQYQRMIQLVGDLDAAIDRASTRQTLAVEALMDRFETMDNELEQLRDDVQRERTAFGFIRKNTAMTLRKQADELPKKDYSKKHAYNYIADRIESSGSYGDIIYQLSRIPENNAQAETLLAVDRANVVPLSRYHSTVPGLTFPVRIDGEIADGANFMISSGFGELRLAQPGTGGFLPHLGVDIINVENILTVTPGNTIVRFPGEPGSVVAACEGTVLYSGFDSIYGWSLEISCPLRAEWTSQYRKIEKLTTFYAHMAEDPGWTGGDTVQKNEKLGIIGDTGTTTGPHLHFEIRIYRSSGEFSNRYGRFDRINPYVLDTFLRERGRKEGEESS